MIIINRDGKHTLKEASSVIVVDSNIIIYVAWRRLYLLLFEVPGVKSAGNKTGNQNMPCKSLCNQYAQYNQE